MFDYFLNYSNAYSEYKIKVLLYKTGYKSRKTKKNFHRYEGNFKTFIVIFSKCFRTTIYEDSKDFFMFLD